MKWKLAAFLTFFGSVALAVVLAIDRGSLAQTTKPSAKNRPLSATALWTT
jgi:hypothetical protein